jgi:hypothetical protein
LRFSFAFLGNFERHRDLTSIDPWGTIRAVPYEVTFRKNVVVSDSRIYINECCWGGDIIKDELLPLISSRFGRVQTEQEDWGGFVWIRDGTVRLAVDIFCDKPKEGLFRIRLTSKRKRLLGTSVTDTPQLEELLKLITSRLKGSATNIECKRVT